MLKINGIIQGFFMYQLKPYPRLQLAGISKNFQGGFVGYFAFQQFFSEMAEKKISEFRANVSGANTKAINTR